MGGERRPEIAKGQREAASAHSPKGIGAEVELVRDSRSRWRFMKDRSRAPIRRRREITPGHLLVNELRSVFLIQTSVAPYCLQFPGFSGRKQSIHPANGQSMRVREAVPFRGLAPLQSTPECREGLF